MYIHTGSVFVFSNWFLYSRLHRTGEPQNRVRSFFFEIDGKKL